jgi:hypothetical protein
MPSTWIQVSPALGDCRQQTTDGTVRTCQLYQQVRPAPAVRHAKVVLSRLAQAPCPATAATPTLTPEAPTGLLMTSSGRLANTGKPPFPHQFSD